MNEIETKILDVDKNAIESVLREKGAQQIGETRLYVDWYQTPGTIEGQEAWYLRIRNSFDGGYELTWKGKHVEVAGSREVKEIHFHLPDHEKMRELLTVFGLETYAHQEKDRSSWRLGDWRFDIDTYPGVPTFVEIEGTSGEHIDEAARMLGVTDHERWNDGERTLMEKKHSIDWKAMYF